MKLYNLPELIYHIESNYEYFIFIADHNSKLTAATYSHGLGNIDSKNLKFRLAGGLWEEYGAGGAAGGAAGAFLRD